MKNIIESPRCILRPLTEADKDNVLKLYTNADVRRFLGGPVQEETFNNRFPQLLQGSAASNWTIRLKEDESFVGIISIDKHHDGLDQEVSYQLSSEFWGQGYAAETVDAVINYASDVMKLPRIIAETQSANEPSRKLLERLGMKEIKTVTRFGAEQTIYCKNFP